MHDTIIEQTDRYITAVRHYRPETENKLRSFSNIWYEKPCSTILQKSGTWVQLIRELLSHELIYDMKKLLNKEGSSTK